VARLSTSASTTPPREASGNLAQAYVITAEPETSSLFPARSCGGRTKDGQEERDATPRGEGGMARAALHQESSVQNDAEASAAIHGSRPLWNT